MQVLTDAVSVSSVEKVFNCSQINQNRLSGLCYSRFSFFIDLCNRNAHVLASFRIYENTVKNNICALVDCILFIIACSRIMQTVILSADKLLK